MSGEWIDTGSGPGIIGRTPTGPALTAFEIPDELLSRAQAQADADGEDLNDVVNTLLRFYADRMITQLGKPGRRVELEGKAGRT